MSFDVFISYSTKDKATADATCALLETNGVRCWIAPRDIMPGMEWGEAIVDALESCSVMVLVFSSNANESRQIRREVERAENRGVPVVPLRIENVEPTKSLAFYMGSVHWLDALTPPLEQHIHRLAEVVQALKQLNRPAGESSEEKSKSEKATRALAELSDAPPTAPSPPTASGPGPAAATAPPIVPEPERAAAAPTASPAPTLPLPPPPTADPIPAPAAPTPPPVVAAVPVPFFKRPGAQVALLIGLCVLGLMVFKALSGSNNVTRPPTVTTNSPPAVDTAVMTWTVMSSYKYKVQVAFYSQTGEDREWPGNGDAYNLDDSLNHEFPLTCNVNEKVCLGAWATGNTKKYWGVGYQNKSGCTACCFICGGGNIPRQVIK